MIALDPKATALVLIDLQNGIIGRKLEPLSAGRNRSGDSSVLVRGARDDSALGLCYRSGFHWLSRGSRHHP